MSETIAQGNDDSLLKENKENSLVSGDLSSSLTRTLDRKDKNRDAMNKSHVVANERTPKLNKTLKIASAQRFSFDGMVNVVL